jgi:predicted oxidoreductase
MAEAVLLLVIGGIFLILVIGFITWLNRRTKKVCEDGQAEPNEAKALKAIYEQCKKTGAIADDVLLATLDWRPKQLEIVLGTLKLKRMIEVNMDGDITLTDFGKNYCEVFLGC